MKRKWLLPSLFLIVVVVVFALFKLNVANKELDSLSGKELKDAISSKGSLSEEETHMLQQREEWDAVESALQSNKVQPTPQLFSEALQLGTPEVVEAYLDAGAKPFDELNGEPVVARVYGGNTDPDKWKVLHQRIKDDRLLPLAVNALDHQAVQALLDSGVEVSEESKETILNQPVRHNDVEMVELLIHRGASWTAEHEQLAKDYRSDLILEWMDK